MGANHIRDNDLEWEVSEPGIRRKIMAYADAIMMVKVAFDAGAVGAVHAHPHAQCAYVESGAFEAEVDGDKQVLRAGDVFLARPNTPHGVVCLEPGILIDVFSPKRDDFLD